MEFQHIATATRSAGDTPRDAQHGSTTTDGKTSTRQQGKVVSVTSLKQATWIKSKLQATKLSKGSTVEWRQSVTHRGTKEILSDLPNDKALTPGEIFRRWPNDPVVVTMRRIERSTDLVTQGDLDADAKFRVAFSKPASKETILAHLIRVTAIKPIKGTNKNSAADGDAQTAFLLDDYTTRLHDAKVTEVDLFIALEHFIENDDSEFFPSYAKLKKEIKA